jgi:hypothetical protein
VQKRPAPDAPLVEGEGLTKVRDHGRSAGKGERPRDDGADARDRVPAEPLELARKK